MTQKLHHTKILGMLTLCSSAHQTSPGEGKGNEAVQIKTAIIDKDGAYQNGVPFITANSVRGQMRRFAGNRVLRSVLAKGELVSRDTLLCVLRGAPSRTGIGGTMTLDQISKGRANVFAGLFGGGAAMMPSNFRFTKDLLPMIPATEHLMAPEFSEQCRVRYSYIDKDGKQGKKGERISVDVSPYMLLEQRVLTGRDDLAAGKGLEFLANPEETFMKHVSEVAASNKGKADSKTEIQETKDAGEKYVGEQKKSDDLRGINMFEMIIPGTRLAFDLRSTEVNDAQIGMVLLSILDFCVANRLGGQVARGCGSFAPSLTLHVDGKQVCTSITLGSDGDYSLAPECAPYVAAAEKVIAGITNADLEQLYPVVVGEPKAKGRKADASDKGQPVEAAQ